MKEYQEALDKLVKYSVINYPTWLRAKKQAKILQELVDKAKPRKVIYSIEKDNYYCPNCNRKLSRRIKYYYCPKKDCGQALDFDEPFIEEELEN